MTDGRAIDAAQTRRRIDGWLNRLRHAEFYADKCEVQSVNSHGFVRSSAFIRRINGLRTHILASLRAHFEIIRRDSHRNTVDPAMTLFNPALRFPSPRQRRARGGSGRGAFDLFLYGRVPHASITAPSVPASQWGPGNRAASLQPWDQHNFHQPDTEECCRRSST